VSGAMGIEPSKAGDNFDIRTLAQPIDSTDDLSVTSLEIRNHIVDVRHVGRTTSSMTNRQGSALRWKAEFAGECGSMHANGRAVRSLHDSLPGGVPLCSTIVTIPAGGSATVTIVQYPRQEHH